MRKSIGGLLTKLTSSGKLDAGVLRDNIDEVDNKKSSMAEDGNEEEINSEDFKFKKSFSYRGLPTVRAQEIVEDDFNKKKSSSMRNMPIPKIDKLNETEDKSKKSSSLRIKSSKSQETPTPPSVKTIFPSSEYEQHFDFNVEEASDEEDDSGEEAHAVPKPGARPRVNSTFDDFDEVFSNIKPSTPIMPKANLGSQKTPPVSASPSLRKLSSPPPKVPSSSPPNMMDLYASSAPSSSRVSPPNAQVASPIAQVSSTTAQVASPSMRKQQPSIMDTPINTNASSSAMKEEMDEFDAHFSVRDRSDSAYEDDDMLISPNVNGINFFHARAWRMNR
jgi:hypothetical protein